MDTRPHASLILADLQPLLDPAPLRLETGITRLDNGLLVVAVRTDLHAGCKGRMLTGVLPSKPPSTSSGGIRTITSSIAAGTATGGAAKAMWARRSMRSSRWPTSRPWRRA